MWIFRTAIVAVIAATVTDASAGYESNPLSFDSVKTGEMRPVQSLIGKDFDRLCVLTPYQERLGVDVADSQPINTFLSAIDYRGDESGWALVLQHGADIEILRFRRSATLDILETHAAKPAYFEGIRGHFTPMTCVEGSTAAFAKIEMQGRIYIVLGKAAD